MKAIITSIATNEIFEIDNIPPSYYEYDAGNNVNRDHIDEFCDLVEDSLPDSDDWDNGYGYKIIEHEE